MTLGDFLRKGGARCRRAGVWDCCTFPADWARLAGWPDPMASWRGSYDSEEKARQIIDEAGGLDVLFARGMAEAGIPEIIEGDPVAGDIGVIQLLGEQAGAVYTGKRWAFVADRGIAAASITPDCIIRSWRAGHG